MKIQMIRAFLFLGAFLMISSCSDDGMTPVVTDPEKEEEMEMENTNNGTTEELVAAPDFSINTWDDKELKFSTYENKVLVIWFFGSDCPPCKAIGPEVEDKLNKSLRGKNDYAIIGIDQWDRNNATVEGFMSVTGVEFPLGAMGSGVAKDYDTTYDRLVVVNKEGKIAYKATERANKNIDEVVDLVNKLID